MVLHFDRNIVQLMDGKTEGRLAIALSSPCNISRQIIVSPTISDGSEDAIAKCLLQVVNEFKLLDGIPALVFDIATSNTGQWKGSSIIFEAMLKYPLFWLACRHHMPELFIKHASTKIVEEITKIQWRNKGSR